MHFCFVDVFGASRQNFEAVFFISENHDDAGGILSIFVFGHFLSPVDNQNLDTYVFLSCPIPSHSMPSYLILPYTTLSRVVVLFKTC